MAIITTLTAIERCSTLLPKDWWGVPIDGRLPPRARTSTAGRISAVTVTSNRPELVWAAVRSNTWRVRLLPPTSIDAPRTSSEFPITEPTSDALTTSWRPSRSAKKAMISSGAFPKVTFSKPAIPGPDRSESCSVASLISAAAGITASADEPKTSAADACPSFRPSASGMNTLSQ